MLTRLRVSGFKNLAELDVRLGPFTCIAGPNGVGKSNLFDAIAFLSALARLPLLEAARSVRTEGASGDVRSLFTRVGGHVSPRMSLSADMIIPAQGVDDLGQQAKAGITFVRYTIELEYVADGADHPLASLRIVSESLEHIKRSAAHAELPFRPKKEWRESVVKGRRTSPYISTGDNDKTDKTVIQLHADSEKGEGGGRPRPYIPSTLPRTVLSSVNNAVEHRTAVLVRKEMMGWTQLHLEPSALRAPDPFATEPGIASNGAHMPATLYSLQHGKGARDDVSERVALRVAELVDRVDGLSVEKDDRRQLFELVLTDRNQTTHYARSLSDGTLRFLALAILDEDPAFRPLLCLEEPENGIHPARIPAMLQLLRDIAVDTTRPVGDDNPLRQVLINTHSPLVVGEVESDALLLADSVEIRGEGAASTTLRLSPLSDTWRAKLAAAQPVARGKLLEYLSPPQRPTQGGPKRVLDRPEVQMLLFGHDVDAAQ